MRRDADGAGMRNFMSYDRRWLDEPHVGDHVGRPIWALGDVLDDRLGAGPRRPGADASRRTRAARSRNDVSPAHRRVHGPRPRAPRCRSSRPTTRSVLLERCVEQLAAAYASTAADGAGSGSRTQLTYDNARLPQALILGGTALGATTAVEIGLELARLAR